MPRHRHRQSLWPHGGMRPVQCSLTSDLDQAKVRVEVAEVIRIGRHDLLATAVCADNDVSIDDVGRSTRREQPAGARCVHAVERDDLCCRLAHQLGEANLTFGSTDCLRQCGGRHGDPAPNLRRPDPSRLPSMDRRCHPPVLIQRGLLRITLESSSTPPSPPSSAPGGSKRCTSRDRRWRASFGTYGSTPIMTSTFDASSAGKGSSRLPSYTTTSFRRAQLAARGSISVATPGPRDVQTARSWLWLRSPYRCRRPTPWTATASPPGERGTRTATGVRTHRARWPRPGRRSSRYQ